MPGISSATSAKSVAIILMLELLAKKVGDGSVKNGREFSFYNSKKFAVRMICGCMQLFAYRTSSVNEFRRGRVMKTCPSPLFRDSPHSPIFVRSKCNLSKSALGRSQQCPLVDLWVEFAMLPFQMRCHFGSSHFCSNLSLLARDKRSLIWLCEDVS